MEEMAPAIGGKRPRGSMGFVKLSAIGKVSRCSNLKEQSGPLFHVDLSQRIRKIGPASRGEV